MLSCGTEFGVVHLFDYSRVASAASGPTSADGLTLRVIAQQVADCFGVVVDSGDARHEISAVSLEEECILGPVTVFILILPHSLERTVVSAGRI